MNDISRLAALVLAMGAVSSTNTASTPTPGQYEPDYPQSQHDQNDEIIAAKYREERLARKIANVEKRKPRNERA